MLITTTEINNMYLRTLFNKFLNEEKNFKIELTKNNFKKETIKELNGFNYIYGHNETFGYYFVAMDKNKDGFIWVKPYDFKEPEEGIFYTPRNTKYKTIKENFYNIFNIERCRDELIAEIRNMVPNKMTKDNFMMRLFFSHRLSINKPMQSKLLCQYMISLVDKSNSFGIDSQIQEEIDKLLFKENEIKVEGTESYLTLEEKKVLISGEIIKNFEKYLKKKISIEKLLKDINNIYFK